MSAEAENVQQDVVQADTRDYVGEAQAIGWVDKPDFKGDPAKWVDAKTYITRGKEFIPFLKASNNKLESQVKMLQTELQGAKRLLTANEKVLSELKETSVETAKAATEQELKDLRTQIVEARRAGEFEKEEELRDKLEETRLKLRQPTAGEKPPSSPPDYTNDPAWKQFVIDNPWWDSDPVMRAASLAIGQQLAADHKLDDLTPPERFAKIADETRKRFGAANARRQEPSRVASTRTPAPASESGSSFEDLPQEAKDACARLSVRLVGDDKKFKTMEAWQADYAKTYFGG